MAKKEKSEKMMPAPMKKGTDYGKEPLKKETPMKGPAPKPPRKKMKKGGKC